MQIMTAKTTTLRTLYVHVVLHSAIFPQILCDRKYHFDKLCFQLLQNITRVIRNFKQLTTTTPKWTTGSEDAQFAILCNFTIQFHTVCIYGALKWLRK